MWQAYIPFYIVSGLDKRILYSRGEYIVNKSINVIFLDVDGVLNCNKYIDNKAKGELDYVNDVNLERLQRICEATQAQIVLSSTWKVLPYNHEMYIHLENKLAEKGLHIWSKTYTIGPRPKEIKAWLTCNSYVKNYVIFDDDYEYDDYKEEGIELENHLITTSYWVYDISEGGILEEHVKQAIDILSKN